MLLGLPEVPGDDGETQRCFQNLDLAERASLISTSCHTLRPPRTTGCADTLHGHVPYLACPPKIHSPLSDIPEGSNSSNECVPEGRVQFRVGEEGGRASPSKLDSQLSHVPVWSSSPKEGSATDAKGYFRIADRDEDRSCQPKHHSPMPDIPTWKSSRKGGVAAGGTRNSTDVDDRDVVRSMEESMVGVGHGWGDSGRFGGGWAESTSSKSTSNVGTMGGPSRKNSGHLLMTSEEDALEVGRRSAGVRALASPSPGPGPGAGVGGRTSGREDAVSGGTVLVDPHEYGNLLMKQQDLEDLRRFHGQTTRDLEGLERKREALEAQLSESSTQTALKLKNLELENIRLHGILRRYEERAPTLDAVCASREQQLGELFQELHRLDEENLVWGSAITSTPIDWLIVSNASCQVLQ